MLPGSRGALMPDPSTNLVERDQNGQVDMITVLHCHDSLRLTKAYHVRWGCVQEESYGTAKHFQYTIHKVNTLNGLYEMVSHYCHSPRTCLIRGIPVPELAEPARRLGNNFPMHSDGSQWACLDFDGVDLPPGVDPYGPDGIEFAVKLLPPAFHSASYIAQFSASAGVMKPGGIPYKPGLRAHLFFWFDRKVTNEELKGWLFDYPVDKALFTPVQPHYIADPILGPGVQCAVNTRLYLKRKDSDSVQVPDLSEYRIKGDSKGPSETDWENPEDGLPSFDDLLTCEFVDWYLSTLHPDGERYEQTRAFAHNLRRIDTDDWETLLRKLIPSEFPYTDAIVTSAADSRPISCGHIYRSAYRCPRYNPNTGCCRVNNHAKTPYSLALWMKRGTK